MKKILPLLFVCCLTCRLFCQNSFTLSTPIIFSTASVPNNYSPPTAYNRQDKFNGSALGLGMNLTYSFNPNFLLKNKKLFFDIGLGYFKQYFSINRPFDYPSPLFIIFYTKDYSYDCISGLAGVSYHYQLPKNLLIKVKATFNILNSFRQTYISTYPNSDAYVSHNQMKYGDFWSASIGLRKKITSKFVIALDVTIPVNTRWRNDKIFGDNPNTFFSPKTSWGFSFNASYLLVKK